MKRVREGSSALFASLDMSNFLRRAKKTSKDQVELYVQFLEEYPNVAMARSNPNNDETIGALWESLTGRLNSSDVGPYKTMQQWQETFANWRYQLRFKARRVLDLQERGSDTNLELGLLELRALKAIPATDTSDKKIMDSRPFIPDISELSNYERPKKTYSKKRIRSTTPVMNRRSLRNSFSNDSSFQKCEDSFLYAANPVLNDVTSYNDNTTEDQKPTISLIKDEEFSSKNGNCTQTENPTVVIESDSENSISLKIREISAINKLEEAVHSLNETLKSLVEVQSQILDAMAKR